MLFNSYIFIFLFLPITIGGFLIAAKGGRQLVIAWLIIASLFFYGWWNPSYLWLLLISISVNRIAGVYLYSYSSKLLLILAIAFNFFLIGYFKYAGFLVSTYGQLTGHQYNFDHIILPLGISFFTFQQIIYLVDSYKRVTAPHGWLEYIAFVTFFPQLIAGPIVHQEEMLPQFKSKNFGPTAQNFAIGFTIFVLGLFKKVVIADQMATYASPMFTAAATGETISFLEAWGGALSYTFQLYFDFSGYSDMAIGLARIFGVKLPLNFNSPYKATSIIEFWRRWHMTLSRFLRDYLYIPLGGSRVRPSRRYTNVMIVMFLGGLWHGAGWTFIFWGCLHGFFILCNALWREISNRFALNTVGSQTIRSVFSWLLTFLCVTVAWVFFRAENFDAAINILKGMSGFKDRLLFTVGYSSFLQFFDSVLPSYTIVSKPLLYFSGKAEIAWIMLCFALVLLMPNTQEWMHKFKPSFLSGSPPKRLPRQLQWRPTIAWGFFITILFGVAITRALQPSEFLYFQF